MNVSSVLRPDKRLQKRYISNLGIQAYGIDNLYPQTVLAILQSSPTGSSCLDRYETFVSGDGFKDMRLYSLVVNRKGDTADDILQLVAKDLTSFGGFALHANYDMRGRIVELQHIPFENCRLHEEDDLGYMPFIEYHIDWTGQKTLNGKKQSVSAGTVKSFFPFNPELNVVLSQIEKSGGIERYNGQILWVSTAGRNTYPIPVYDKILTSLSTDEALDNIKYRNSRNNFLPAGMLIRKKGAGAIGEDGEEIGGEDMEDLQFISTLKQFQGDTNACSILDVKINADEDKPEWQKIEAENFDKAFSVTESSVTERIYSAFGQEVWHAIRVGKLGFSGNTISEAYEYYNSYVSKERRMIERAFAKVFNRWTDEQEYDCTIAPLSYVRNETT